MPKHVKAKKISKFQGVYKDISLVVDKNLPYNQIATLASRISKNTNIKEVLSNRCV